MRFYGSDAYLKGLFQQRLHLAYRTVAELEDLMLEGRQSSIASFFRFVIYQNVLTSLNCSVDNSIIK